MKHTEAFCVQKNRTKNFFGFRVADIATLIDTWLMKAFIALKKWKATV